MLVGQWHLYMLAHVPGYNEISIIADSSVKIILHIGIIILKYKSGGAVDYNETSLKSRHVSRAILYDSSPKLLKMSEGGLCVLADELWLQRAGSCGN